MQTETRHGRATITRLRTRRARGGWLLGLFYVWLSLTQDLHHNHGLAAGVGDPAWMATHGDGMPCPVELFQLAHGDTQPLPVFDPCLLAVPALPDPPAFDWPSRRGEAPRSRGPPVLS